MRALKQPNLAALIDGLRGLISATFLNILFFHFRQIQLIYHYFYCFCKIFKKSTFFLFFYFQAILEKLTLAFVHKSSCSGTKIEKYEEMPNQPILGAQEGIFLILTKKLHEGPQHPLVRTRAHLYQRLQLSLVK